MHWDINGIAGLYGWWGTREIQHKIRGKGTGKVTENKKRNAIHNRNKRKLKGTRIKFFWPVLKGKNIKDKKFKYIPAALTPPFPLCLLTTCSSFYFFILLVFFFPLFTSCSFFPSIFIPFSQLLPPPAPPLHQLLAPLLRFLFLFFLPSLLYLFPLSTHHLLHVSFFPNPASRLSLPRVPPPPPPTAFFFPPFLFSIPHWPSQPPLPPLSVSSTYLISNHRSPYSSPLTYFSLPILPPLTFPLLLLSLWRIAADAVS